MKFFAPLSGSLLLASSVLAQPFLVENGQSRSEIVISDQPTRMQRVAADELRMQIEKISGAKLPIVTRATGKAVKIFIGASAECPVKADGLADGAYRITTGPDWMALTGDDRDYTPLEPFARHNGDIPRAEAEWQRLTASTWSLPGRGLYKHRMNLPGDTGKPDGAVTPKNEVLTVWGLDERGSFNAVCGFLHRLGARYYLPGELGEVLPALKTIPLPRLDETVRPDFALRQFNFRFGVCGPDTARWVMRLGLRGDERFMIAHGMDLMTGNDATFAAHPEWFALYGGKRDYTPGYSKNQLCYSDDGLFRETVRFARAVLDRGDFECVSIMPPDGYTAICQCEKCRGKDTPERDERGLLSDYVWDFVNRVAREVAKTHPGKKVLNCAYGAYTLPPLRIARLEPNVLVGIVGGRRPMNKGRIEVKGSSSPADLRAGWARKTSNPILFFENYPFTDRGWYMPAFAAQALAGSVDATKGLSMGEDIWLSVRQDFDKIGIGFNHFLVYFTARAYWSGPRTDADAMLREYCRLFYGPAEAEMLAFFTFCEANWAATEEDKAKADEALALFGKAKAKADAASLFGRRLALVDEFLKGLRMKSAQLGQKRGPVPTLRLVGDAKYIVIDGRLDDEYWRNCPVAATASLRELQTGRIPAFGTSVKAGWQGSSLCFAIRCEEEPGKKLNRAATREDDPAIWRGDAIEIELATESHSYYQIAISPDGHLVDLDRGAPHGQWFGWDSKAEVATHVADDHWIIEIRIPVTQDENDPLHQVLGRKPIQSLPWHFNICRQRLREDGQELSAFSPTGTDAFHVPLKFARLYDGRSHVWEADPEVSDFIIAFRAAQQKRDAAAFLALAGEKHTPEQIAATLEQAALLDPAHAEAAIERIPVEAVKKTAHMVHLLATGKAAQVIADYGAEDFSRWPFWKRGDGLHARGRAFFLTKAAERAEADLKGALQWIGDPRARESVLLVLGQNREHGLKQDDRALEAYQSIVDGKTRIGGADEYSALQGIARILTRGGRPDEALRVLGRAEVEKLQGVWKANIQKSIEAVKAARKSRP